jgi:hypothetical protein
MNLHRVVSAAWASRLSSYATDIALGALFIAVSLALLLILTVA